MSDVSAAQYEGELYHGTDLACVRTAAQGAREVLHAYARHRVARGGPGTELAERARHQLRGLSKTANPQSTDRLDSVKHTLLCLVSGRSSTRGRASPSHDSMQARATGPSRGIPRAVAVRAIVLRRMHAAPLVCTADPHHPVPSRFRLHPCALFKFLPRAVSTPCFASLSVARERLQVSYAMKSGGSVPAGHEGG